MPFVPAKQQPLNASTRTPVSSQELSDAARAAAEINEASNRDGAINAATDCGGEMNAACNRGGAINAACNRGGAINEAGNRGGASSECGDASQRQSNWCEESRECGNASTRGGKIETVTATYSTGNCAENRAQMAQASEHLESAKREIRRAADEYSAAKSNQSSGAASATMVRANEDILANAQLAKATARAASAAIGDQARNAAQAAYSAVVSGVAEDAGEMKVTLEEGPRVAVIAQSEARRIEI